jgi:hypothetical protein
MDQVVCIDDDWTPVPNYSGRIPLSVPIKEMIYTPIQVRPNENGVEYFVFAEFREPWGWRTKHFRPVKKTNIGDLAAFLKPTDKTKKREKETA